MTETYMVPDFKLSTLQAKIATLSKKAVKINGSTISLNILPPVMKPRRGPSGSFIYLNDGSKLVDVYYPVSVEAPVVKIQGHTFVAKISHTGAGNVILKSPSHEEDLPERFRNCAAFCEHCQIQRRRNSTFVLLKDNGDFIQVGGSCLQNYLGIDPKDFIALATLVSSTHIGEGDEENFGGGRFGGIPVTAYLANVSAVMRAHGFVSKAKALNGETPTSELAFENVYSTKDNKIKVTDLDFKIALETVEHFKSRPTKSEFDHNMAVVVASNLAERNSLGILAYTVQAYHIDLAKKAEAKNLNKNTKTFGTVGDKCEKKAKAIGHFVKSSDWGSCTIGKFLTSDNEIIVIYFSKVPETFTLQSVKEEKVFAIKGTVKAHKEFNGEAYTVMQRCKLQAA